MHGHVALYYSGAIASYVAVPYAYARGPQRGCNLVRLACDLL